MTGLDTNVLCELVTEEAAWSGFSLASALRGMEGEDVPYTLGDVTESFQ